MLKLSNAELLLQMGTLNGQLDADRVKAASLTIQNEQMKVENDKLKEEMLSRQDVEMLDDKDDVKGTVADEKPGETSNATTKTVIVAQPENESEDESEIQCVKIEKKSDDYDSIHADRAFVDIIRFARNVKCPVLSVSASRRRSVNQSKTAEEEHTQEVFDSAIFSVLKKLSNVDLEYLATKFGINNPISNFPHVKKSYLRQLINNAVLKRRRICNVPKDISDVVDLTLD